MRNRLLVLGLCLLLGGACAKATSAQSLALSEQDNGKAYTVHVGDIVTVTLHSTYWGAPASDPIAVLSPDGEGRATSPGLGVSGCPRFPGSGCGTMMREFTARTRGHSSISSSRTTCGEALQCVPPQHFAVTIVVQ